MQIVIPMSGFGERFRRAGYSTPKPLIEVDGKPIIGHVIDLFPGETDFIFICNEEHLANKNYQMENILKELCPTGRIVSIPPHKLGPVNAVFQAKHLLDLSSPVVVNYCDFTCHWDWQGFKLFVEKVRCDGAIPAYKGFHPHTLGTTNYAYLKEEGGWVTDIQEKTPFTDNRMEEYASSGTYYFATGALMLEAFELAIEKNLSVGGEFYVSLAYKPILEAKKKVAIYSLEYFMQWGTPEDLAEYNSWSQIFRSFLVKGVEHSPSGSLVIPMAGMGSRFTEAGYSLTKPLIPVSGRAMAIRAIEDLPDAYYQSIVLRANMPGQKEIIKEIQDKFPEAIFSSIPELTDGQACTALIGLDALEQHCNALVMSTPTPITFGACDNGVSFDQTAYNLLIANPDIDVIVWGVRGHVNAIRCPQMFGWIDADKTNRINAISVKKPLADPAHDPIVIGTFTFKVADNARRSIQSLMSRNGRVNGEFYLDSCINDAIKLGLRCYFFEVESFILWGTPNDLKTFQYWQSCFHKWGSHPYRIELDQYIDIPSQRDLIGNLSKFSPMIPNGTSCG